MKNKRCRIRSWPICNPAGIGSSLATTTSLSHLDNELKYISLPSVKDLTVSIISIHLVVFSRTSIEIFGNLTKISTKDEIIGSTILDIVKR